MKIVYPMQLEGENGPSEVPSLDAFIEKINSLKSGTFLIGRNRIWHGGIHLSEKGGWHPSGAVHAIADGEIVAYRLATEPAKATRSPEAGKQGEGIDLYTSPSFCLLRHHYEAGEQNKNRLTFYCLYMHIACENTYNSPEAARVTVKGTGVSTYEPVAGGDPLKLTRLKQVTGKSNYTSFNYWHQNNQSKWPNDIINAVDDFEILSKMKFATRSAAWFWISNSSNANPDSRAKCFDYANEASDAAVDRITNIINLNTDSRQKRKNNFWRLWNEEVLHDQ